MSESLHALASGPVTGPQFHNMNEGDADMDGCESEY